MIGLSLTFFLMFILSPRGVSVSLYQQKIYRWNKNRIGHLLGQLDFKYKVMPYTTVDFLPKSGWNLQHSLGQQESDSLELWEDFEILQSSNKHLEKAVQSIYLYEQSFFTGEFEKGVFPNFDPQTAFEIPTFCVHLNTKSATNKWMEVEDQKTCEIANSKDLIKS